MRLPWVSRRRHKAVIDMVVSIKNGVQAELEGERDKARSERDAALSRVVELEQAIRAFVASEDTHEPGPFVKDGNWHPGRCVEGGPRMEDVYPDGFQVCADDDCGAYWPCDVERLHSVLDGHDRQEPELSDCQTCGQPLGESSVNWLGEGRGFRHPTYPDPLPPREGRWSQGIPAGQHDLAGQPCATCGAPLRAEGSVARFNTQTRWSHKPCLDGVARREREGGRR